MRGKNEQDRTPCDILSLNPWRPSAGAAGNPFVITTLTQPGGSITMSSNSKGKFRNALPHHWPNGGFFGGMGAYGGVGFAPMMLGGAGPRRHRGFGQGHPPAGLDFKSDFQFGRAFRRHRAGAIFEEGGSSRGRPNSSPAGRTPSGPPMSPSQPARRHFRHGCWTGTSARRIGGIAIFKAIAAIPCRKGPGAIYVAGRPARSPASEDIPGKTIRPAHRLQPQDQSL